MHVRKDYGSNALDKLMVYFMKTVLRIQKHGLLEIPIDVSFGEPIDTYLKIAIGLLKDAQPPEVVALVLQIEREHIAAHCMLTKEQITLLVMTEKLAMHVRFDDDPADYLLSGIENLWFNNAPNPGEVSAAAYATKTFYKNLSAALQKKHGLDKILQQIPPERFALDDF